MATIIADLRRTMESIFRFGNINLKDSSGVAQVRNAADSAFANVAAHSVRVQGNNGTNAVVLTAPNSLGGNVTYSLPGTDGASGDVLKTDGSGTLSWDAAAAGSTLVEEEAFSQATSSPLTICAVGSGERILQIEVEITAAAAGGSPTLSLGITGSPTVLMTTAQCDLKETGNYVLFPAYEITSGTNIIATIVTSSQTFSGYIRVIRATPS